MRKHADVGGGASKGNTVYSSCCRTLQVLSGLYAQLHEVRGQLAVLYGVGSVENEVDEVETGEKCRWQLHILHDRSLWVPP